MDSDSEIVVVALTSGRCINLFNGAKSSTYGFRGGFVHSLEGKVMNLDPKGCSLKSCVIHQFLIFGVI